jgi:aldose 1-epimerase
MSAEKKFCFCAKTGEDVYLFTLRNANGTEVLITNYGAIIIAFKIKMSDGSYNDIVLGFDTPEEYISENYLSQYAYLGAAIGRYANRIKNSSFSIDNTKFSVTPNMGKNQLHGGKQGFDKKIWEVISFENNMLQLKYLSKDGEEGFPGNLETIIRFELNDEDELSYEFTATTDKPTAVNLTHHSYFNLNNGEGAIDDTELKIYSSYILAKDEEAVCTGELIPVENTEFDFREFHSINERWKKEEGYDHCFVIDNKKDSLQLVAEAREKGIVLQIFSTDTAVQFYTGQGIGKLEGKDDNIYGPYSGFCLETQKYCNAVNIPQFPNTILRPGEKYFQKNVYKVINQNHFNELK